jgi:hypothetical protein
MISILLLTESPINIFCSVTRWDARNHHSSNPESSFSDISAAQMAIRNLGCEEIATAFVTDPIGTTNEMTCHAVFNRYLFNNYSAIIEGKYDFVVNFGNGSTDTCKDTYTPGRLPIPELVNWSNGDVTKTLTPYLDWNEVPGAERYWVRFWNDTRTTIIYDSRDLTGWITETEHTIPPGFLESFTTYSLEIIAIDKPSENGSILRIYLSTP